MSTSVEANEEAVEFMLMLLATLSDRDGNGYYRNNSSLISKLRAAARATGSIEIAVNKLFF